MTTPNEEIAPWRTTWQCKEFLEAAKTRVGSIGALLEMRRANLWRIDSYRVDEWGVTVSVTNLPLPGFSPPRNGVAELGSAWETLHVDEGRWQSRYGWKFLLGDAEMESVIAAGAEAASRGLLLNDSHVLIICRWRTALESKKDNSPKPTDFAAFLDSLFAPHPTQTLVSLTAPLYVE